MFCKILFYLEILFEPKAICSWLSIANRLSQQCLIHVETTIMELNGDIFSCTCFFLQNFRSQLQLGE